MKKTEEITEQTPEPSHNVMFVGKIEIKGELVPGEPFTHYNNAGGTVLLPDAETQKNGFYFEKQANCVAFFRNFTNHSFPKDRRF